MLRSFQKTVVFSALDRRGEPRYRRPDVHLSGLWSTFGIGPAARDRVER